MANSALTTMSRRHDDISSGSTVSKISAWVRENKLKTVGTFWGTTLGTSLAWNFSKQEKLSLKLIHARVHAQGVTLAALAAAGLLEYLDRREQSQLRELQAMAARER